MAGSTAALTTGTKLAGGVGEDVGLGLHGRDKPADDGTIHVVVNDIDAKHVGVPIHIADKIALPGIDTIIDDGGVIHFDDAGFIGVTGQLRLDHAIGADMIVDHGMDDVGVHHIPPLHQLMADSDYLI